jgi:hypothetical protein
MKDYPLVSIISLLFNDSKDVINTLNNFKSNNYPNIQHIIVDDHSNMIHYNTLNDWLKKSKYKAILYRNEANIGPSESLNFALGLVKGKYLGFNSNDIWTKTKVAVQVELLETNPMSAIVFSQTQKIEILEKKSVYKEIFPVHSSSQLIPAGLFEFPFYIQSSLIRVESLKKINFRFNKKYISEDWLLIIELILNFPVIAQNEVTTHYLCREESLFHVNWSKDKIAKTVESNLKMFLYLHKKYNSHKNSGDILRSINNFYCWLVDLKNSKRKNLILISFRILLIEFKKGQLLKCFSIIFFNDFRVFQFFVNRSLKK